MTAILAFSGALFTAVNCVAIWLIEKRTKNLELNQQALNDIQRRHDDRLNRLEYSAKRAGR